MRKDAKIALIVILVLMVLVVVIWGHSPRSTDIDLSPGHAAAPGSDTTTTTSHALPPVDTRHPDLDTARYSAPGQPPDDTLSPSGPPAMINHVPTRTTPATITYEGTPPPTRPVAFAPSTGTGADTSGASREGAADTTTPPTPPAPPKPKYITHKIVKGDNYTRLARRYYGDDRKWRLIFEANRIPPQSLRIGQEIRIPVLPEAKTTDDTSGKTPGPTEVVDTRKATGADDGGKAVRTHTVKKGESFYSIACAVYRDPGKWQALYTHNKARLPKPNEPASLRAGTVIELPDLASTQ